MIKHLINKERAKKEGGVHASITDTTITLQYGIRQGYGISRSIGQSQHELQHPEEYRYGWQVNDLNGFNNLCPRCNHD